MIKRSYSPRIVALGAVTTILVAFLAWNRLVAHPFRSESQLRPFTEEFMLESCTFSPNGRNPYFVLEPGHQLVLAGEDAEGELELVITVLPETKRISVDGVGTVRTRVVEERETVNGEMVEISRNFFALCVETNSVFYFGEEVDIFEDGEIVGHEGVWRAGENGARSGLIMPGTFLLGSRYFQELAPEVAMDRGENVAMNLTVVVPAGTFEKSVMVVETTPLESSEKDVKIYAPGVGLIVDESAQLVDWHEAP